MPRFNQPLVQPQQTACSRSSISSRRIIAYKLIARAAVDSIFRELREKSHSRLDYFCCFARNQFFSLFWIGLFIKEEVRFVRFAISRSVKKSLLPVIITFRMFDFDFGFVLRT